MPAPCYRWRFLGLAYLEMLLGHRGAITERHDRRTTWISAVAPVFSLTWSLAVLQFRRSQTARDQFGLTLVTTRKMRQEGDRASVPDDNVALLL